MRAACWDCVSQVLLNVQKVLKNALKHLKDRLEHSEDNTGNPNDPWVILDLKK